MLSVSNHLCGFLLEMFRHAGLLVLTLEKEISHVTGLAALVHYT